MPPAYRRAGAFQDPSPPQFCKKAGYDSRRQAAKALKDMKLTGADGMHVYRCKICTSKVWHHGHAPQTHDKRRLRAKRMARRTQEEN